MIEIITKKQDNLERRITRLERLLQNEMLKNSFLKKRNIAYQKFANYRA